MEGEYKSLSPIEAIRLRPGMFIGEGEDPSHLITEILDNASDELTSAYANLISVKIENGECWISDNGRGIQSYTMEIYDGTFEDSVVALCTIPHTGSKFDNNNYESMVGMNGIGLVITNALSDWLVIRTRDRINKNIIHEYNFLNAVLHSKNDFEDNNIDSWSTLVGFKPSEQYFSENEFDLKRLASRLILTQSKYPTSSLFLNNKPIPKFEINSFIKKMLDLPENEKLYKLEYDGKKYFQEHVDKTNLGKIDVWVTFTNNDDIKTIGDVNLRLCEGFHLTQFQNTLKQLILQKISKKFKTIPDKYVLLGLRTFVSLTIPEPKFDSQTKSKLVLKVQKQLIDPITQQIEWFLDQDNIVDIIISNIENKLKRSFIKPTTTTKNIKRVSAENKLRDCRKIPGETIYIIEGDSALNTLKQVRNLDTEAIFPLKGKILNVETNSLDRITNNKEIQFLIEALGPESNRRYKNIKILCDGDADGSHIAVLTILLLKEIASDYIKQGRVYVILPPLYGAVKGKQYIPIYNHSEIDNYKKNGYDIMRFKGLGEMSPDKLEVTLNSKMEYRLEWPETNIRLETLSTIITNSPLKRKLMNEESLSFENVLNHVKNNLDKN